MGYEEAKARADRFADYVAAQKPAIQRDVELRWLARMMHGAGHPDVRKPCRVSYGWCFTHMERAAPRGPLDDNLVPDPGYIVSDDGWSASIGPLDLPGADS